MRKPALLSSLVLSMVATSALVAQVSSGGLSGVVLNKKGNPIAGAKVILSSKALFTPKVLVTDARGEWRQLLLPPGDYEVRASKDGYYGNFAKNIRVGMGAILRQDVILAQVQEVGTTVEVVSSSSTVDKTESKTASNFSAELLSIEVGAHGDRGFMGALDLAPGVVTEGPSQAPSIRGGSLTSTNFTVNGADVKSQTAGQVDDVAHGGMGNWYVQDNIEDVQVVLSPLNARFGRAAGGSVNVVTKTGGNDFDGSIRATFDRQSWTGQNAINPVTYSDSMYRSYDVVLTGPLVKDRLWFDVATILTPSSTATNYLSSHPTIGIFPTQDAALDALTATSLTAPYAGLPGSAVPAGYGFGIGQNGAQVSQASKSNYIEAKLTGAITQDHIVEYAFTRSNATLTNTDPVGDLWHSTRLISLGTKKDEKNLDSVSYRGTLSNQFFVEARYNTNSDKTYVPQGDPNYGGGQEAVFQVGLYNDMGLPTTAAADHQGDWWYGYQPFGPWASPSPETQKTSSYNIDFTYIMDNGTGTHQLEFGLDGYQSQYSDNSNFATTDLGATNRQFVIGGYYQNLSNPEQLIFPVVNYNIYPGSGVVRAPDWAFGKFPSVGLAPVMIQYTGPAGGSIKTGFNALFVNDSWTVNQHWNIMGGLRYEKEEVHDSTGANLIGTSTWSPRLQVRYDLKGDSRSLITFTAAQFQGDIPQAFINNFASTPQSSGIAYGMNAINGGQTPLPLAGDPTDPTLGLRFINFSDLVNSANYGTEISAFNKGLTNQVDPNLKPQTLDEFTLGYSRTFNTGSSISFTYVRRDWHNLWAMSQDYQPDQVVTITQNASYGIMNHYFNSSALTREYNALEMVWTIKTRGIWSFNGNWSYSRLTGNDEQGDDAIGASSLYNGANILPTELYNNSRFLNSLGVPSSTYAPDGRLVNDLTNRIRLGATATIPVGKGLVTLNWVAHYADGSPYGSEALAAGNSIPLAQWGLPNITAGTPATSVAGGAANQNINGYIGGRRPFEENGLASVDFRAAFKFPLPVWRMQVFGDVVINNFFNHIDSGYYTAFNSVFGTNPQAPGQIVLPISTPGSATPGFGQTTNDPRQYIAPRNVVCSLGLRF